MRAIHQSTRNRYHHVSAGSLCFNLDLKQPGRLPAKGNDPEFLLPGLQFQLIRSKPYQIG